MILLQQDPASLASLRDIVEPEAIPFWPIAPGWWVVIGVVLAVSVLVVWRALDRRRRNAYRRAALAELATLDDLAGLPSLLKRTALGAFPREQVASLAGEEWLRFLDDSGDTTDFTDGPGRGLIALAYTTSALSVDQRRALLTCTENWIRRHERVGI